MRSGVFSACSVKSHLRCLLFSNLRAMDRFVCGFSSWVGGNDRGWFFLGFVILFCGVFPLGFVNLCGTEVVSGSPYIKR